MARDVRHNAKLCALLRFAAGHTIRHYVKCLPQFFVASFSSEPVRVGGRKRGFAQGPSPALTRRKTPYFAGPRPQSTCSCRLRHSVPDKEDVLAVAGSLQIIFLVFHSRAGSLQLRQSAAKKLFRSRSFQSLLYTAFRQFTSYASAPR